MKPLDLSLKDYEQYERYVDWRGNARIQYDYRDKNGNLFSCIKNTLEDCRRAKYEWLQKQEGGAK